MECSLRIGDDSARPAEITLNPKDRRRAAGSIRIEITDSKLALLPLRNWIRAAFGQPWICGVNNLDLDVDQNRLVFNIGFPLEEAISVQFKTRPTAFLDLMDAKCIDTPLFVRIEESGADRVSNGDRGE